MKKLFFLFFLTLFFFAFSSPLEAQNQNTFDCFWNPITQKCNVPNDKDRPKNRCGFRIRDAEVGSICNQHNDDEATCEAQTNNACPGPDSPQSATQPQTCASGTGIPTALGCLSFYPQTFLGQIVPWAIRLAGGIAFLLILLSAFQYITAAGNPDQIKAAQEQFTAAFTGLIIIVFAIILLRTIGVDILGLNQFGF